MSRRLISLSYTSILALLIVSLAFGGEVRKLGSNDLEWGYGITVSTAGKVVTKIPRYFDNNAFSDNLTLYGADLITKGPWIDVRAYGAVANDSAKGAVNSAAFQAAADYLKTTGGGTILVPVGDFRLASKVTIYNGTRLVGMSMEGTIISGSFSGALIEMMPTVDNVEVSGTWVEHLTVNGLDNANGGYGISILGAATGGNATRQSGVRDVRVKNLERGIYYAACQSFSTIGVSFQSNTYGTYYYSNDGDPAHGTAQLMYFQDCDWRYNYIALYGTYVAGSKPYGWTFVRCHIEANEYGFLPYGSLQWSFYDCKWEQNDHEAIHIYGVDQFRFYGNHFNNNADVSRTQDVLIESQYGTSITNGGHVFIGCSFDNSATPYSISVKYTRNVTLIGCHFQTPDASDSGTRIQNINSDVTILNPVQSVPPDPAYGQWKTLTSWITGSDYPYKNYGIIPKPSSIDNGIIYVRDIDIHVVEAFDNTSGTFAILQTGVEVSAQYFAQGVDLLSTGVKEITWNNRGYYNTNNEFFRGTIVTDGAIDTTKGKAIVTITYIEVPVQP